MKTLLRRFAWVGIVLLFAACSSDEEDAVTTQDGPFAISELAGNWEATRIQFSGNTATVDVVADGGTATLSIQSSGRFTITIDPTDRPSYTESGRMFWEVWEGNYYFAIAWDEEPGDWDTYGHNWDGTTFSLNGGFDSGAYDFDYDGTAEPCSLNCSFVRS